MKLKTTHLFPFIRLVTKMDIKNEIKGLFANKTNVKDMTEEEIAKLQQEKGMDMAFMFIEKLSVAEKEFYDFFALYSGKKVDELKEQEISETIDMIKHLFKDEAFASFFKSATR